MDGRPETVRAFPTLFFSAAVFVPGHMFKWAVEWLWLAATLFVGMIVVLNSSRGRALVGIPRTFWLGIFGALSVASALSVSIAVAIYQVPIEPRDVVELLRFPVYGLLGAVVGTFSNYWSRNGADRILRAAIWFIVTCTIVYVFKTPVLYPVISGFIYKDAKTLVELGVIRLSIPFENPNYLGFFMMLCLIYFGFYRKSAFYFAIGLVVVFLTGSRSAWIAVIPILGLAFALSLWRYSVEEIGLRTIFVWASPIIIAAAIVAFWEQLQYFSRLAELADALKGGGVSSVRTADLRFAHAGALLDWFARSPIFGWGPGRALGLDVADNQYVSWLVTWGIVGTTLLVFGVALLIARLIRASATLDQLAGAWALLISLSLMIFTGDFLENYRMFFLTLCMMQLYFNLSTSTKDVNASVEQFRPRQLCRS